MNKLYKSLIKIAEDTGSEDTSSEDTSSEDASSEGINLSTASSSMAIKLSELEINSYSFKQDKISYMKDFDITGDPKAIVGLTDENLSVIVSIYDKNKGAVYDDLVNFIYKIKNNTSIDSELTYIRNNIYKIPETNENIGASIDKEGNLLEDPQGLETNISKDYDLADLVIRLDEVRFELTGLILIENTQLTPQKTRNKDQHNKIINYLKDNYDDFKNKITNISNLDLNSFSGVSLKEKVSDHLLEILAEKLPPEEISNINLSDVDKLEVSNQTSAFDKIIYKYINSLINLSKATGDLSESPVTTTDIAEEGDFSTVDVSPIGEPSFEENTTDIEVNKALYYYATSTNKFNYISRKNKAELTDYSNLFKVLLQEESDKYHECQAIEVKFFDPAESSSPNYDDTGIYEITYIFAGGDEKILEFLYSNKTIRFKNKSGSATVSDSNFIINQNAVKAGLETAKRLHLDTIFKGISDLPGLSKPDVSIDARLINPLKKVTSGNGLSVLDPNSNYLHSNTNVFDLISKLRDSQKLTMDADSGEFTQARGIPIPLRGSNLEIVTKNISYKNSLPEKALGNDEIDNAAQRGFAYIDVSDQTHYNNKSAAALNFFKEDQQTLSSIKLSINSLVSKIYAKAALNLNEKYATGANQDMTAGFSFSDPISNEALASVAKEIFKNHIDDVQGIYRESLDEIGVENPSEYVSEMSSTLQSGLFNIAGSYAAPSNYNSVANKALEDLSEYQYTPNTNEASDFIIKDSKWNNNTNIRDISNKKKFKSRVSKLLLSHFHKVASGQGGALVSSNSTDNLFSGNTSSATNGMASVVEFLGSEDPYEINIKIEAEIKASAKDIGIYYDIPDDENVKALFEKLLESEIEDYHGFKIRKFGETYKLEKTLDVVFAKSSPKDLIFSSFVKETNGQSVSYGKLAEFTDMNGSQIFSIESAPSALSYFTNISEASTELVAIDPKATSNILGVKKNNALWRNTLSSLSDKAGKFKVTLDKKSINYTLEFNFKGDKFDLNMKIMPVQGGGSATALDSTMDMSGYFNLFKAIREGSLNNIQRTFLNPDTNSFVHGNEKAAASLSPDQFFEAVTESSKSFIPNTAQTYDKTIVLRLDNTGSASYTGLTDQRFVFNNQSILTGDNLIYHKSSDKIVHNSNPNIASSISLDDKNINLSANPLSPIFRKESFGSSEINPNNNAKIRQYSLYDIYIMKTENPSALECLDINTKNIFQNIENPDFSHPTSQTLDDSIKNLVLAKASFDNHYNSILEALKNESLSQKESDFYKKLKKAIEDSIDSSLSQAKNFRKDTVFNISKEKLDFSSDEAKRVMALDAILSDVNENNNLSILARKHFPSIDDSKIHMKVVSKISATSPVEVLYAENYISRFAGQQIKGDESFKAIQHALSQASGDNFYEIYKDFSANLKSLSVSDLDSINTSNYRNAEKVSGEVLAIDLNSFSLEEKDSVVRQLISLNEDSFKIYAADYLRIEVDDLTEAKLKSNMPKILNYLEKDFLEYNPGGSIYTADEIATIKMRSSLVVPEELFSVEAKVFENAEDFYAYMKENAEFGKYIEGNSSRINLLLNSAIRIYSNSIAEEVSYAKEILNPADFSMTFASKDNETKQYFNKENLEDAKNALVQIDSEINSLNSAKEQLQKRDPNRGPLLQDIGSLRSLKTRIGLAIEKYNRDVSVLRSESLEKLQKADEHINHLKKSLGEAQLIFEKNIFEEVIDIDVESLAKKGIDSDFILKLSQSDGEFAAKLFLSLNSQYSYVIRNAVSDPSISAEIYRNLARSIESSNMSDLDLVEDGYSRIFDYKIANNIEIKNSEFLDSSEELLMLNSKKSFYDSEDFSKLNDNNTPAINKSLSDDNYLLYNKANIGAQDVLLNWVDEDVSAKISFYTNADGTTNVTITGLSEENLSEIKGKYVSFATANDYVQLYIPNDFSGNAPFVVNTEDVSSALEEFFFRGDNYIRAINSSDRARFQILESLIKDNEIRFEVNVEQNQLKSAEYKILYFYKNDLVFSSIYSEEKIVQFARNSENADSKLEAAILDDFLGTTGIDDSNQRINKFKETVSKYNSSSSILRALKKSDINSGTRVLANIYSHGLESTKGALDSLEGVNLAANDFIGKFHTFFDTENSTARNLIFDISKYNSEDAASIRKTYSDFKAAVEYYNTVCFDNPLAAQEVLDEAKQKISGSLEDVSRVLYYLGFNIANYSSNALGPLSSNMSVYELNNLKKYFDLFTKINASKSNFFTVDDFNNNVFKKGNIASSSLDLVKCSSGESVSIKTVDQFVKFMYYEAEFFLERGNVQLYQQLMDELVKSVSISSIEIGLGALKGFAGLNLDSGAVSNLVRFMRRSFGSMFPGSHIGSEIGKDIKVLGKALVEMDTVYADLNSKIPELERASGEGLEDLRANIGAIERDIELIMETIKRNYSDSNYQIGKGEKALEKLRPRLQSEIGKAYLDSCIGKKVGFLSKSLLNLKSFLITFISLCNPLNSIEVMSAAYLYGCFREGGFSGGAKKLALDLAQRPARIVSHLVDAISYANPASWLEGSMRYSTNLSHANIANIRMRAIGANQNLNLIDDLSKASKGSQGARGRFSMRSQRARFGDTKSLLKLMGKGLAKSFFGFLAAGVVAIGEAAAAAITLVVIKGLYDNSTADFPELGIIVPSIYAKAVHKNLLEMKNASLTSSYEGGSDRAKGILPNKEINYVEKDSEGSLYIDILNCTTNRSAQAYISNLKESFSFLANTCDTIASEKNSSEINKLTMQDIDKSLNMGITDQLYIEYKRAFDVFDIIKNGLYPVVAEFITGELGGEAGATVRLSKTQQPIVFISKDESEFEYEGQSYTIDHAEGLIRLGNIVVGSQDGEDSDLKFSYSEVSTENIGTYLVEAFMETLSSVLATFYIVPLSNPSIIIAPVIKVLLQKTSLVNSVYRPNKYAFEGMKELVSQELNLILDQFNSLNIVHILKHDANFFNKHMHSVYEENVQGLSD